MSFDFPASPTAGQVFTPPGGPTYVWQTPRWLIDGTTLTFNNLILTGNLLPAVTGTLDIGSATKRWRTVYTSDLSLSNGVGDWTIVEGEDDLFLYNNKRGKVYRFALIEVDPEDATPKRA